MTQKTKAAEFAKEGYNIKVLGRHVLVTDAMKNYAVDKIAKMDRFHSRIIDVAITMDVQKLEHSVDIILQADHTKIRSHASSEDMYASIDFAVDKLQRQLTRYKKRIQDHHATARGVVDMRVNVFKAPDEANLEDVNDQIEDETVRRMEKTYLPHQIVSEETLPLKTLNMEEALWHMELSKDSFMVYRSEEDQKLKVIYRREEDGNFGVVEPEA